MLYILLLLLFVMLFILWCILRVSSSQEMAYHSCQEERKEK